MSSDVLCLFAHQDDEYGIAPRIALETEDGRRVACVYLTNGSAKGSNPAIRDAESREVLLQLGVADEDIFFLGSQANVPDGRLVGYLEESFSRVLDWLRGRLLNVETIFSPAWEGGHTDHDACHLVAASIARALPAARAWQFPLYNGQGVPWKFFRVLKPLRGTQTQKRRLPARTALHFALLCLRYRSQKRTWLGLLPEAFWRRAILREEIVGPFDVTVLGTRPHAGTLLYERLFGGRFESFAAESRSFRERHVLSEAIIPAPKVR